MLRSAFILAKPQWEWFPSSSEVLQTVFGLIILQFILKAAGQMSHDHWTFFMYLHKAMSREREPASLPLQ